MKYRAKIDRVPERLLNECGFCHKRGIKPGILEVEYPKDAKTRARYLRISEEMSLNAFGFCDECAAILSQTSDFKI